MESLYNVLQISRQAFHQHLKKRVGLIEKKQGLIPMIRNIRREHPRLSCRKLHRMINPQFIGRDRFEQFCFANGFKLLRKKCFHRTTDSRGVTRFDNHMAGREFTRVNQAWVSDITYYRIGENFYYITLIMDRHSRVIVGYSVSKSLRAEATTLPALSMAISLRQPPPGLILHSDGGGQYYCNEIKALTKDQKFINSMGKCAYENPYAERINGTIKNDYLIYYHPTNYSELVQMVKKAVDNYNNFRPHTSLKELTPLAYENFIHNSTSSTKRKKEAKKEKLLQ